MRKLAALLAFSLLSVATPVLACPHEHQDRDKTAEAPKDTTTTAKAPVKKPVKKAPVKKAPAKDTSKTTDTAAKDKPAGDKVATKS